MAAPASSAPAALIAFAFVGQRRTSRASERRRRDPHGRGQRDRRGGSLLGQPVGEGGDGLARVGSTGEERLAGVEKSAVQARQVVGAAQLELEVPELVPAPVDHGDDRGERVEPDVSGDDPERFAQVSVVRRQVVDGADDAAGPGLGVGTRVISSAVENFGGRPASIGKLRRIDAQNPWIVPT